LVQYIIMNQAKTIGTPFFHRDENLCTTYIKMLSHGLHHSCV
jgi:hypothetical protein